MNRRSFIKKAGAGSCAVIGGSLVSSPSENMALEGSEDCDVEVFYRIQDNRTGKVYRLCARLNYEGDDRVSDYEAKSLAESLYRSLASILDGSFPHIENSSVYGASRKCTSQLT